MVIKSVASHEYCAVHPFKRICWTAVFVGALVGVGLGFLLNLFGIAIGLSAVTVNKTGAVALAVGGFVGYVIAMVASMVVAGYAAGYLGRRYCPKRNLGILYGFVTWSAALLLSAAVMTHVQQYASGYGHTIAGSTVMVSSDVSGVHAVTEDSKVSADKNQSTVKMVASTAGLTGCAFLLFALFFIGAISTCLGACWAMSCKRDD